MTPALATLPPVAWALIPAKSFARAKSRLAGPLGDDGRAALARSMFDHVVDTARHCDRLAGVLVATDGDDVERACAERGVLVLRDRPEDTGSLGAVVDRALATLATRDASVALVLMADLPRLRSEDLAALLVALDSGDLALAPDRAEAGTNALALRLPAPLPMQLGHDDSFTRHVALARQRGLKITTVHTPTIAHDVDEAGDL